MNTSRLIRVLSELDSDLSSEVLPAIQALVQTATTARDTPAQDFSEKLQSDLSEAQAMAERMWAAQYPPSAQKIVVAAGLAPLCGEALSRRIAGCFEGAAMTPATAVRKLTELQKELDAARRNASAVVAGLAKLGIEEVNLEADEYELGVLLPETAAHGELGTVNEELKHWNQIVRAFQEAAGDEEREVRIRSFSDGSLLVFLGVGAWVAHHLMTAVERLLAAYERILDIRLKREELARLGVPPTELSLAKKTEKELIEKESAALLKDLTQAIAKGTKAERKQEIESHLKVAVSLVAKFLDKGGQIEITVPPIDDPDAENEDSEEADEASAKDGKPSRELLEARDAFKRNRDLASRGAKMARVGPLRQGVLLLEPGEDDKKSK
ncbi:MAG: hypothetical protein KF689_11770 [Gemmatimonadaceae bacterium]|nr:hypothetical protein [Gemmatimonadaceae bacterium]